MAGGTLVRDFIYFAQANPQQTLVLVVLGVILVFFFINVIGGGKD